MAAIQLIRLVSFEKSTKRKNTQHILVVFLFLFLLLTFVFVFQESMEPKEKAQRAQLLVQERVPAHGLLLMELFGSLVVMDMVRY
jgi:hypothetical protein